MNQKKLSESGASAETYDLKIKGEEWLRGLSCTAAFNTIQDAMYELGDPNMELSFVIKENFTGHDQKTSFTVNEFMWEAICESPSSMRMYLRMGWKA